MLLLEVAQPPQLFGALHAGRSLLGMAQVVLQMPAPDGLAVHLFQQALARVLAHRFEQSVARVTVALLGQHEALVDSDASRSGTA